MIYSYLQIRLFVPRYKSFVPIFKYGWHGNIHYFIVDGGELNFGTNDLYLSSNDLYISSNHLYLGANDLKIGINICTKRYKYLNIC